MNQHYINELDKIGKFIMKTLEVKQLVTDCATVF
jgi:hypothetical protein